MALDERMETRLAAALELAEALTTNVVNRARSLDFGAEPGVSDDALLRTATALLAAPESSRAHLMIGRLLRAGEP